MTPTAALLPPWLPGKFAPVNVERDAPHLTVIGDLPRELNGTLFRNGPDPQFTPLDPMRHHWFHGDGMRHAFTLRDGRASHRNRWVRTAKWQAERVAGRPLVSGFADKGVANTNVVWHAGRLLALEEGHLPIEVDPATLATRGVHSFEGRMEGPFTAQSKTDPVTGEVVFFGFSTGGPLSAEMTFGTIGADGRVRRFERFQALYCSMVHDFARRAAPPLPRPRADAVV